MPDYNALNVVQLPCPGSRGRSRPCNAVACSYLLKAAAQGSRNAQMASLQCGAADFLPCAAAGTAAR